MSHANDAVTIDAALHADLKAAAGTHPAAAIAGSPLAKALVGDAGPASQIVNATLTAYLAAIESGPLKGVTDGNRQALLGRIAQAFPGR